MKTREFQDKFIKVILSRRGRQQSGSAFEETRNVGRRKFLSLDEVGLIHSSDWVLLHRTSLNHLKRRMVSWTWYQSINCYLFKAQERPTSMYNTQIAAKDKKSCCRYPQLQLSNRILIGPFNSSHTLWAIPNPMLPYHRCVFSLPFT